MNVYDDQPNPRHVTAYYTATGEVRVVAISFPPGRPGAKSYRVGGRLVFDLSPDHCEDARRLIRAVAVSGA